MQSGYGRCNRDNLTNKECIIIKNLENECYICFYVISWQWTFSLDCSLQSVEMQEEEQNNMTDSPSQEISSDVLQTHFLSKRKRRT